MSTSFKTGAADAYERVMGRWSQVLAPVFVDFCNVTEGDTVLDVGCGTGSLTRAIADAVRIDSVQGTDLSEDYLDFARSHSRDDPRIAYRVGDACALPFQDAAFDRTMSLLVLNFVPDGPRAVAEMARVTRPGGTVGAAVWDLRGGMVTFRLLWDTASVLDPEAAMRRAAYFRSPLTRANELATLWRSIGLQDIEQTSITIRQDFEDFADFWEPLLSKTGPSGVYLDGLSDSLRAELETRLRAAYEAGDPDGPRSFTATAWACRGTVPAR